MPPGVIVSNNRVDDAHVTSYSSYQRHASDKNNSHNHCKNRNKEHHNKRFDHRDHKQLTPPNKYPVSILRRPKEQREVLLPMSPQQQQHLTEALIVRQRHQQKHKQQVVQIDVPPPVEHVYSDSTAEFSAITYSPLRTLMFGCCSTKLGGGGSDHLSYL